jgi:flagellar protein FliS
MNAYAGMRAAVRNQYSKLGVETAVETASPHRLIEMLLDGAMSRIATAKGHMSRGEVAAKGEQLSWAISIVSSLRGSLNLKDGGDIAGNLDSLYDYMERKLLEANLHNDEKLLDEIYDLLGEIRGGWGAIREQADKIATPA